MIEHIPRHLQPVPDPGPYPAGRLCDRCSALLSRNNPADICQPCQLAAMPDCEVIDLHPEDAA